MCAKNYQNRAAFDKVIVKTETVQLSIHMDSYYNSLCVVIIMMSKACTGTLST